MHCKNTGALGGTCRCESPSTYLDAISVPASCKPYGFPHQKRLPGGLVPHSRMYLLACSWCCIDMAGLASQAHATSVSKTSRGSTRIKFAQNGNQAQELFEITEYMHNIREDSGKLRASASSNRKQAKKTKLTRVAWRAGPAHMRAERVSQLARQMLALLCSNFIPQRSQQPALELVLPRHAHVLGPC